MKLPIPSILGAVYFYTTRERVGEGCHAQFRTCNRINEHVFDVFVYPE